MTSLLSPLLQFLSAVSAKSAAWRVLKTAGTALGRDYQLLATFPAKSHSWLVLRSAVWTNHAGC